MLLLVSMRWFAFFSFSSTRKVMQLGFIPRNWQSSQSFTMSIRSVNALKYLPLLRDARSITLH